MGFLHLAHAFELVPLLTPAERQKVDERADSFFYMSPRFVTHVDRAFIRKLEQLYRQEIPEGARVLDLMSSWVSHLPPERKYELVDGHGLNKEELLANPRLRLRHTQDLNKNPQLPFDDGFYDAVTCAVSVQYLQQPESVFAEVNRVLRPGGKAIVSFSNRMFSSKAIIGWLERDDRQRCALVKSYLRGITGAAEPEILFRVNPFYPLLSWEDPFFAVIARKPDEVQ